MNEQPPVTTGQQRGRRSWAEPWKIKMVEPLRMSTRDERDRAFAEAMTTGLLAMIETSGRRSSPMT